MKTNQKHLPLEGPPGGHPEPSEAEIQKEAYYLWREKGCPTGNDLDNWLEAKELLGHRAEPTAGLPPRRSSLSARGGSAARDATRPEPAKAPATIHFPTPHAVVPVPPVGPGGASTHLDFRHSAPPFKPAKVH